ncbi:hypothetical protein [Caballeronia sp. LZ032]|uniref:hypothetical protein n=1 Tax=Caballeronia sp. LZ032 TaxID=3038565 RepID=UPI002861605D|nr:hypothetical protein [Caballeronia sp. LZ032]MDR5878785.1 hypothetical protein [Caballeronia sp. LZ032]
MSKGAFERLVKALRAEVNPRPPAQPENSRRVVSVKTPAVRAPAAATSARSPAAKVAALLPAQKRMPSGAARVLGLPADPRALKAEPAKPAGSGYRVRVGDSEFTEKQVREVCRQALDARRLRPSDATRIETIINFRGQLPSELITKLYTSQP